MTTTKSTVAGLGLAFALAIAAPAHAQNAAVEAPIKTFADAFNKGDIPTAMATHVKTGAVIIDELSPFMWSGPKSFQDWMADYDIDSKAKGITDPVVVIRTPTREVVSDNNAYVIAPALYTFKQKGVAMSEVAQMTFALVKTGEGWKIAGWTWTGPEAVPAK
jgi:ketosteroid isomerase-like protein